MDNMRFYPVIIVLAALVAFSPVDARGNLKERKEGQLRIRYSPSLSEGAGKVARLYPDVKKGLKDRLALDMGIDPVVYLVHDAEFNRMTGGMRLITAFAVPESNIIVIDYSKMKNSSLVLKLTLMHELCHIVLHGYVDNSLLPKWFDEGTCQWVSGGMADIISFDSKKFLKEATITNNYIPLDALRYRFPTQDKALMLSYSESRSIIEYIDETYGTEGLLLILKMLHEGKEINNAIRGSLSISLKNLEKDWHAYLKRKYTWFYFIADNILWIVFILGALITLAGYIRMRIRMKRYFREDEEEFF
jgi:hypothetical protein